MSSAKIFIFETGLMTTSGYLYRARCQRDRDHHLEIGTKRTRGNAPCLTVEVPDSDQIADPQLKALAAAARDALASFDTSVFQTHSRNAPLRITATGQVLFDQTISAIPAAAAPCWTAEGTPP